MPPKVCGAKKQAVATCLPPVPVWPVQTLKKVKLTDIYACSGSMSRPGLPVTSTSKREEHHNLYETLKFGNYSRIQSQC